MTDEFDPYKPGTGLKDDFDGTIVDEVFTPDPQSGNWKVTLMTVDDAGEEWPVNYWLGNEWESFDGGETVKHPKGERQLFSNQSQYSDFIVHAMEAGARDVMYARLKDGMGPRVAANWHGMKFHWDVLDRPARRPKTDAEGNPVMGANGRQEWENTTTTRLLPTKYLGIEGQEKLDVAAGTAAPAPSTTTTDPLAGIAPRMVGTIVQAAKANSYAGFLDTMLDLCDEDNVPIMERPEISQAAASEDWYMSLKNS